MYYQMPAPLACGFLGGIAGLIGGGFNQCFPVWVGATTGASLGCAFCIYSMFIPVIHHRANISGQIVVPNIYIIREIGAPKDIPVAVVVPSVI